MRFQGRIFLLLCAMAGDLLFLPAATCGKLYAGTDIDLIRKRAQSLYEVEDAGYNTGAVVFPELKFDCPGNITSIWLVARENGNDIRPLTFQLWSGTVVNGSTFQGSVLAERASTEFNLTMGDADMGLYQFTLSEPLRFEEGDVFGMVHTQASNVLVQYQDGGGVQTFLRVSATSNVIQYDGRYRYPLVSLGGLRCAKGFLSLRALQLYVNAGSSDLEGNVSDIPGPEGSETRYIVFSSLSFSQNGLLEKWVFAAERTFAFPGLGVSYPEFQVWRGRGDDRTIISNASINAPSRTGYLNVYEYTLDPPQPVQAGDYIGVSITSGLITVTPQWIEGMGSRYVIIINGSSQKSRGQAIPLFAAILQGKLNTSPLTFSPFLITAVSTVTTATTIATVTTVSMYQPQSGASVSMTRRIHSGGGRPAMAGAEDSGGNMVILTSVGVSVGGLLMVAAALTAVLCMWQCSRRRTLQSAPKVPPQYSMAENEAYGAHTQHPQQQQVRNGKRVAPEKLQQNPQFMMKENEAYEVHTHHPQETDLNGYYDAVEWKEEEGNDYVMNEPVYEMPS